MAQILCPRQALYLYGCVIPQLTVTHSHLKARILEHHRACRLPACRGGGGECQPRAHFHRAVKDAEFFQAEIGQTVGIWNSMKKHTQVWKCTIHLGNMRQTAGALKETTSRNQALTCSLVNNQVTLIHHFLIIFSIEEGGKWGSQWRECKS